MISIWLALALGIWPCLIVVAQRIYHARRLEATKAEYLKPQKIVYVEFSYARHEALRGAEQIRITYVCWRCGYAEDLYPDNWRALTYERLTLWGSSKVAQRGWSMVRVPLSQDENWYCPSCTRDLATVLTSTVPALPAEGE